MLHSIMARTRSLWSGLRRRRDFEAEMAEEFGHHLELRTADLVRSGVAPAEAARRARVEFGRIANHQEDARAARGLAPFDSLRVSWLDVKLGARMLKKYPGLSIVSVIGMSVAIAVGAGYVGAINAFMDPTLPLPEGDRIVAIQNADVANPGDERQTLRDLAAWRTQLRTVREIGAFASAGRNLVLPGQGVERVKLARMTASGFGLTRTAPLMGRTLLEADEREGAAPVVVIGEDEWRRVFDADPAIVGRPVRLGNEVHTVVGVMPAGFGFPFAHKYWVPLQQRVADVETGGGGNVFVFGRLAAGATLDEAQAELSVVGARMATTFPATHQHLRPQVMPYTFPLMGISDPSAVMAARTLQASVALLLVLVAANVAILVYARVATRTSEIAMRSALGASRRRIITQLFVEAFVLSSIAAVIGLSITAAAFRQLSRLHGGPGSDVTVPFWFDLSLTPGLIAYAAGLAILAGMIVGVIPALKVTGRRAQTGLQQLTTRGASQQLGRLWTALIVVQVAIAVAVLPSAIGIAGDSVRKGATEPGYDAAALLGARVFMDRDATLPVPGGDTSAVAILPRFRDRTAELLRRLEAEPAVAGVTFTTNIPGRENQARIEVEGAPRMSDGAEGPGGANDPWVRTSNVGANFFGVYGVPTVAGRTFTEADAHEGATAVVVDQVFADRRLAGGPVLGRRVRVLTPKEGGAEGELVAGPWLEVVGVVPDFSLEVGLGGEEDPAMYFPMSVAQATGPLHVAVRTRGSSPAAFGGRLRQVALAVDANLQLEEVSAASDFEYHERRSMLYLAIGVVAVTGSVLLLSATGIYAMMSFTVTRRRREIGIRAALGANPRRILAGVFARASTQLGVGVAAGLGLAVVVARAIGTGVMEGAGVLLLPGVAVLMIAVGLLATLGPARRGLAVQPTEALRDE
ncbi:ABC transporter permease [Roseisolibacter agri]|uniref:Macrolide export ATP-binding/permease protein MacB n=1 Tax=Roseisolibacter agri TaxID=2014610 RepID=A0AA37QDP0_9BACT|nr:ABC transporter permease [Roseisolibacter agri]GLC23843.1 hypothetical protein rosag_03560 [Roseisolibacter agri]